MNKPIKPKEPNKSLAYDCYSYFDFDYEKDDTINKKYPFLYLSEILNHLPEHWENIIEYIKLDFSDFRDVSVLVPTDLDHVYKYEEELKKYNLDLEKYELETAKYELYLAEEKVKNLEKLYAKT
jgi:hypothetical protein